MRKVIAIVLGTAMAVAVSLSAGGGPQASQSLTWGPETSAPTSGTVTASQVVAHPATSRAMTVWISDDGRGGSSVSSSTGQISGQQVTWGSAVAITPPAKRANLLQVHTSTSGRTVAVYCYQGSPEVSPVLHFSVTDLSASTPSWSEPLPIGENYRAALICSTSSPQRYLSAMSTDGSRLIVGSPQGGRLIPALWVIDLRTSYTGAMSLPIYAKGSDGSTYQVRDDACIGPNCLDYSWGTLSVSPTGNAAVLTFSVEWRRDWPAMGTYFVQQTSTWNLNSLPKPTAALQINQDSGLKGQPQSIVLSPDGTSALSISRSVADNPPSTGTSTRARIQWGQWSTQGWSWDAGHEAGVYGVGSARIAATQNLSSAFASWESPSQNASFGRGTGPTYSWSETIRFEDLARADENTYSLQRNLTLSPDGTSAMLGLLTRNGFAVVTGNPAQPSLGWSDPSVLAPLGSQSYAITLASTAGQVLASWHTTAASQAIRVRVGTASTAPASVPSQPNSLTVKTSTASGQTNATISWAPPSSTGGSPVTHYLYRTRTNAWTPWQRTTSTQVVIPVRPTAKRKLLVEVRAVNAAGQGPIASKTATIRVR